MRKIKLFLFFLLAQKRTFKTRCQLLAYQNKRLTSFFRWLTKNSRYYEKFKFFSQLPIITKQDMLAYFDDINTVDCKLTDCMEQAHRMEQTRDFKNSVSNGISVGLSTGTSGKRSIFLSSKTEQNQWAAIMVSKVLGWSVFKPNKVALFLRANNNLYEAIGQGNAIQFKFYDLMLPFNQLVSNLIDYNPTILVAPPSILKEIVKTLKSKNMRISPKKVFSVAETLSKIDERYLELFFNQKILQIYQCTEGFLGISCKYGTIHLNEEYIRFDKKYLDEKKDRFMPIITDFTRKSQPFVNYLLDDVLHEYKGQCPCGSPNLAISSIEGRQNDLLYFKSVSQSGVKTAIYPDFIERAILAASSDIEEYEVALVSQETLELSLLPNTPKIQAQVKNALEVLFTKFQVIPAKILFKKWVRTKHIFQKYYRIQNKLDE